MKTNELYSVKAVRALLGNTLRPGGLTLTRRAFALADLGPHARILDAGCACGTSLAFFRAKGLRAFGLDVRQDFLRENPQGDGCLVQARSEALPFSAASLDAVFCECSWNMTEKNQSLQEFARVLSPGGLLLISDIFARGKNAGAWPVPCCFAQATSLEELQNQISSQGFSVEELEDHSALLTRTAAQCVFAHGSLQGFWEAVTGSSAQGVAACNAISGARPGLFLLKARRLRTA